MADKTKTQLQRIGFGGGCHWCTEAVFASLRGVENVQQGFVRSKPPNNSFSEAILLDFNSSVITLETLIEIHLRTHASSADHSMRKKYRSAIYSFNDNQHCASQQALQQLQQHFDKPLITSVLPFAEFQASEEKFQNYYKTDPERPFCQRFIDPKLAMLRHRFAASMHDD